MWYLDRIKANLTEADRRRLNAVYEPFVAAVPPDDSRRGLCVMPNGELRCYGVEGRTHGKREGGRMIYLYSRNGLDWTRGEAPEDAAPVDSSSLVGNGRAVMGSAMRIPWSGSYITVVTWKEGEHAGTWAELSETGPGDTDVRLVQICDEICFDLFQPVALSSRKRLIVTAYISGEAGGHPCVLISDDDGESWRIVPLKPAPEHTVVFPHRGTRWQNNGVEPNLAELPDGRLMLLARTSLDYFYVYYSEDQGDSWTSGEPSLFHGTLTTPYLLRLSDGRVICFWNNTRPLAEVNHDLTWPPVSDSVKNGFSEDVFTNRDVSHVAITSDGRNWTGFRELALNEVRNAADFRVRGGSGSSIDKSVHQFQALELPYGKILVSYGQNEVSRRLAVFDVNWLYERQRDENFSLGLEYLSTHLYVKSLSDSCIARGYNGHCAWNRTNGALLVPDPDCNGGEVLQICRIHDERLVSELQGAVWNFPAAARGTLKLQLRIEGSGLLVRLCDHWMNPSDEYAGLYAVYDFELDSRTLEPAVWHDVTIAFDRDQASVFCENRLLFYVRQKAPAPTGISYLHMQTMAECHDPCGTLVRRMEFYGD